jgi:hypothetical protein
VTKKAPMTTHAETWNDLTMGRISRMAPKNTDTLFRGWSTMNMPVIPEIAPLAPRAGISAELA